MKVRQSKYRIIEAALATLLILLLIGFGINYFWPKPSIRRAISHTFAALDVNNVFTGTNFFQSPLILTPTTVGGLPAASSVPGALASVNNALTAVDCTVGGGTAISFCKSNGTNWLPLSANFRNCTIVVGGPDGSALSNANLGPQQKQCQVPYAATVIEIDVTADAGTPNIIAQRWHLGTATALLSSALTTAASGATACSNTGGTVSLDGSTTCSSTLENTAIGANDWLGLTSGTAGGTAKQMSISITYRVN